MRAGSFARGAAVAAASAFLAACGSGTSSLPTPGNGHATQNVKFTMHWPSQKSLASRRRPLFISPSTLSLVVEINNDPTLTVIANNPSTGGSAATTTIDIPAPTGNDTFYFSLWDAKDGKGNELGQAQTTQNIAAGKVNTLGATIDGILSKIGVTADPDQPFLETATDAGGSPTFTLVGDVPANIAITPLDADGNVIVAPGVVPSISLASSDSSLSVTQSRTDPSKYTMQMVRVPNAGVHPSLKATGTDGNGFTATTNYPVAASPAFFVAYSNRGAGSLQVFDGQGRAVQTTGSFAGLQQPSGVAYDPDDRVVFVADSAANGGTVFAFTEDGNAASVPPIAFAGATGVAYDPQNGQIYVTSASQNAVGVFTAQGAPVATSGFAGLNAPAGIALAGSNVCITSAAAGTNPACFAASDGSPATSISQDSSFTSTGIAYDAAQKTLWITATSSSGPATLTEYDPAFGFSEQQYATGLTAPQGVAMHPFSGEIEVLDSAGPSLLAFQDVWPFAQDTAATIALPSAAGTATAFAVTY